MLAEILKDLPNFLAYFGSSLVLTAIFVFVYFWITPHDEMALIRAGNSAAAISLAGAVIGFLLPLASVITHSRGLRDMAMWGVVALVMQILGFFIARALVPGLPKQIEAGKASIAVLAATISLGIGIINAACITP